MSGDVSTYLAEVKARVDRATAGPWGVASWGPMTVLGPEYTDRLGDPDRLIITEAGNEAVDADFIAAARTDVPKLVAALEAVLSYADEIQRYLPGATRRIRTDIATALGDQP